jgi:hypothetical protein
MKVTGAWDIIRALKAMVQHLETNPGAYVELSFREAVDLSPPDFLNQPYHEAMSQAAVRGVVRRFAIEALGDRRRQSRLRLVVSDGATDPAP